MDEYSGIKCPECGWTLVFPYLGIDTNPHCPSNLRWKAIRPEPPSGINDTARKEDTAWFAANPGTDDRVRPLSLDEQVRFFAGSGAAVTHVRVHRAQGWGYVGGQRRSFWSPVGVEYW